MKTYKLIRTYPGSPVFGFILDDSWKIKNSFATHATHCVNNLAFNPVSYPEYWEEIVQKDYKILSMLIRRSDKHQERIVDNNDSDDYIESLINCDGNTIHSVKRLSDGEIFTVGNKINLFDTITVDDLTIDTIEIINNQIRFANKIIKGTHFNLSDRIINVRKPLFTTEDGVDIFDTDRFYICGIDDWKVKTCRASSAATFSIDKSKKFSTIEKAEAYALMNKPCLSLKDIETSYIESFKSVEGFLFKLKELVKTKL